jgi:hypothetical protein
MIDQKTVNRTLEQLCQSAENNKKKHDIANAMAEISINEVDYQIQILFVADKYLWLKEDEVRFQEATKIDFENKSF